MDFLLDKLAPFLIASLLGLVIGIERERRQMEFRTMGVRTFVLLGLLGALAGVLQNILLQTVVCVFVMAAIIVGYLRSSAGVSYHQKIDIGLTTEIAGYATFIFGFLAHKDAWLSATLGLLVLIVLLSRNILHRFSKEHLKSNEIQAAVILFVLILGILPFVPSQPVDPWGIFNLKQLIIVVTVIAGVQFLSYIAMRLFGNIIGLSLAGFLSGFISSTAAFLTLPRLIKKDKELVYLIASSAIWASVSTLILLLIVVAVLSIDALWSVIPLILPLVVMGALFAYLLARKHVKEALFPLVHNPLSLHSAIRLGGLLVLVITVIFIMQKWLGVEGLKGASFVGGLFELHGASISAVSLYNDAKIDKEAMRSSIALAVLASILSKIIITFFVAKGKYVWLMLLSMLSMLFAFLMLWWIF